ncbi:MAG TPA: STT3 domain-containing protein [Phycisphaerae bacterium]|nr:hypothetical protein [Phycisphaerales bacterium]HRX84882.1 STT3 domain-containing protein [Phycisphaerae bacterium]
MSRPVALVVAIGVATLFLRCAGTWRNVFAPDGVVLAGVDPWYHLRRIEHVAHNFPYLIRHDPYALQPAGEDVLVAPLFDLTVLAVTWAGTLSHVTDTSLATVAALLPPLCAALLVAVTYALAATLFNRRVGVLAALLVPLMPGPLQRCTMLGFADHHAFEALFSALVLLCLARALSVQTNTGLPGVDRRALRWALLAGVALGAYLASWIGGLMLIGLLGFWMITAWPFLHRGRQPTQPLTVLVLYFCLAAAACVLPLSAGNDWVREQLLALAMLVAVAIVLPFVFPGTPAVDPRARARRRIVAGVIAVTGITLGAVYFNRAQEMRHPITWYLFSAERTLVEEASPLYMLDAGFSLRPVWETFGLTLPIALAGWLLLMIQAIRRADAARLLLVAWTVVTVGITLQQRRFAYYSSTCVAALAALAVEQAWMGWRRFGGPARQAQGRRAWWVLVLGAGLLYAPCAALSVPAAWVASGPSPDWRAALVWLRSNTPEPFGDAQHYLARYDDPARGALASGYGVLSSWDRGYWILQLGRRVPCGNPTQANAAQTAEYLVAESEAAAAGVLDRLGARYVMLDYTVPVWDAPGGFSVGKFTTLARWAGVDPSRFVEVCQPRAASGGQAPLLVFHPAYYRTMAARLYTFCGQACAPQGPITAAVIERSASAAHPVLADLRRFPDYATAAAFVAEHAAEGWELVGLSPFDTCVPLEPLARHHQVYQSPTKLAQRAQETIACVEIYEYTPAAAAQPAGP